MGDTYDLLIIFTDGKTKVVSGVSNYRIDRTCNLFIFVKNGYQSMIPIDHVKFFGRKSDWGDTSIDSLQAFVNHINGLSTCNDCSRKECEYKPSWGKTVRYNCPLYLKGSVKHMNNDYKEVYFNEYCKTCKYEKTTESEEPCSDCLNNTANLHSHKPIRWTKK